MDDADTIDRVKSRRVQVASLPPADSGRGFARLPDKLMDDLGLNEGDVIEIVGKRSTAARAIRPYGEDEGIDIIRMDGLQRANAGVGSGDFVQVRKAESKPATRVVFAPAQANVRLQGSADALRVVKCTAHEPRHASTGALLVSRNPEVTTIEYVVPSARKSAVIPARMFVDGSKTSWRSPVREPSGRCTWTLSSVTDATSIGPENGMATRG